VHRPVGRVFHQVGGHQYCHELHHARQRPKPFLQPGIHRPGKERRHCLDAHEQKDADGKVIDDEVSPVVPEVGPQDRLITPMRHDLLQRREQRRRGQQVENEPIQSNESWRVVAWPHFHRAAAQVGRQYGQQDAERPQSLLTVQHESQHAEAGGEDHPRRQQLAHQHQVVADPQRRCGEVVREHEAQNGQHAQRTECNRKIAADPALTELKRPVSVIQLHDGVSIGIGKQGDRSRHVGIMYQAGTAAVQSHRRGGSSGKALDRAAVRNQDSRRPLAVRIIVCPQEPCVPTRPSCWPSFVLSPPARQPGCGTS
jgi:ribosomal protein L3